jgi:GNAT superfamily N-acetyltransferase
MEYHWNVGQSVSKIVNMRIVEHLSEEQRQVLHGWGADPFGLEACGLRWRSKDRHVLRYDDGRLVAKASVLKHRLFVAGQPLWVGGVGGVITIPAAQKRGHATALMQFIAAYLRDDLCVPFGLLFCREALMPFYARLGWQLVQEQVVIEQPGGDVLSPVPVMVLACSAAAWPEGSVRLASEPW